MIFDNSLILVGAISPLGALTGQAISGAGTVIGQNTVDLGPPMLGGIPGQLGDIGAGEQLAVSLTVTAAPTAGTSVTFQIIQADDPALTTNVQVLGSTSAMPIASLPSGTQVIVKTGPTSPYVPKRYLAVQFVNVGAIAGLAVFGGVLKDTQSVKLFRTGFAVQ